VQFPYTRYQAQPASFDPNRQDIELPHIPITLIGPGGREVEVLALVDSGADISYLGPQHAHFLGIDIRSGLLDQCTGIGGANDCYYHSGITIEVGSHRLKIGAHFAESWPHNFAILGRKDFFERFKVTIDELRKLVSLTPHK